MGPIEFSLKIFPMDENLQQELAKLEREGWQSVPGLKPAVSYVMFRAAVAQQQSTSEGKGGITVDDSKVHIVRGG